MNKLFFLLFFGLSVFIQAQVVPVDQKWAAGYWEAQWITHPDISARDYAVIHFRKSLTLDQVPGKFIIHVSGDNRYRLLVNGQEVGIGPARGDIEHWRFETYDIAPFLKPGKNVLAATVWNFGEYSPVAQMSNRTGLIVQGDGEAEKTINTNASWKVYHNTAYKPEMESRWQLRSYLVVGPGDIVDGKAYPWGWEMNDFDDASWKSSRQLGLGKALGKGTDGDWLLVPRDIPMMEGSPIRLQQIRRQSGTSFSSDFLAGKAAVTIPANSKTSVLLDQSYLTNAYPELSVSGGEGSRISLTYSEALFDGNQQKGNRDEVAGKEMRGVSDVFLPDGGNNRTYRTLWFRTWRYLQVEIETGTEPLVLHDLRATFTGYPFEEKAGITTDLPWVEDVWEVGWRTARLCAGENYYDCPYYEQLQYVGDTRIQALISLYVTGDDRLMKKAINDFEESRVWNGLTQSRYPSEKLQLIPTYSLFWIAMVHDYWMHKGDEAYVRAKLPVVRSVLEWYEQQVNEQGMLGRMKYWHFVDWTDEWAWNETDRIGGVPSQDEAGNSSVLATQYAYALQYAEELYRAFGDEVMADTYTSQRADVLEAIRATCWDEEKQLFSDTPGANVYSQHANMFAILTDAIPLAEQPALMERILSDPSLIQATFYFKFYLFRALVKTGMTDRYFEQLQPWNDMLAIGLTTFAEKPDPTRSDCHAWSAAPNYDLLSIVAGIRPSSPGFRTVEISPSFGQLTKISAFMPHPEGEIKVDLTRKGNRVRGIVVLPQGITGKFRWKENDLNLVSGQNQLDVKN
ncbi:MAG: alpha-L-rhamnosidase N-terminal domain-containing protein [Cyclobacteriaceae bacterium]|nr:alpha-L-rhamnosidase N-terminal domain-containing protein [Cyclobacteriaceae bacterium]